jgi:hypothetical protein
VSGRNEDGGEGQVGDDGKLVLGSQSSTKLEFEILPWVGLDQIGSDWQVECAYPVPVLQLGLKSGLTGLAAICTLGWKEVNAVGWARQEQGRQGKKEARHGKTRQSSSSKTVAG